MSVTKHNFYKRLQQEQQASWSSVPQQVLRDTLWRQLTDREEPIVRIERAGGGQRVVVAKPGIYQSLVTQAYPGGDDFVKRSTLDDVGATKAMRSSHAGGSPSVRIIFLRGQGIISLNDVTIDPSYCTKHFGFLAAILGALTTDKLCMVENFSSFRTFEQLLPHYTLLHCHRYGKLSGEELFEPLAAKELIYAPDYDFEGLNNYLACKEYHSHATLYMPDTYDEAYKRYSRELKGKQYRGDYPKVHASQDPLVVKIRTQLLEHGRFLEQQALFL